MAEYKVRAHNMDEGGTWDLGDYDTLAKAERKFNRSVKEWREYVKSLKYTTPLHVRFTIQVGKDVVKETMVYDK